MSKPDEPRFSMVELLVVLVAVALVAWLVVGYSNRNQSPSHKTPKYLQIDALKNLRELSAEADQYMISYSVKEVSYKDMVKSGILTESIIPTGGENYSSMEFRFGDTQLSISSPAFGTVTYSQ